MSAIQQILGSFGATPNKLTTSADFSTSTYLSRGGDLTGVSDSATGTVSFWFRIDGGNGTARVILYSPQGYMDVRLDAVNKLVLTAVGTSGSSYIQLTSSTAYLSGASWHHALASWDLNGAAGVKLKTLYIDDVLENGAVLDAGPAAVVDYTRGAWFVSEVPATSAPFDGCLSELWFAPGQYIDFSIAANRSKFRNAAGHPIDLGSNGSTPTGTSPAVYLSNSYATFPTNNGTGGNFSVAAGALSAGSTAP